MTIRRVSHSPIILVVISLLFLGAFAGCGGGTKGGTGQGSGPVSVQTTAGGAAKPQLLFFTAPG